MHIDAVRQSDADVREQSSGTPENDLSGVDRSQREKKGSFREYPKAKCA